LLLSSFIAEQGKGDACKFCFEGTSALKNGLKMEHLREMEEMVLGFVVGYGRVQGLATRENQVAKRFGGLEVWRFVYSDIYSKIRKNFCIFNHIQNAQKLN
jgi:hypothetical protein